MDLTESLQILKSRGLVTRESWPWGVWLYAPESANPEGTLEKIYQINCGEQPGVMSLYVPTTADLVATDWGQILKENLPPARGIIEKVECLAGHQQGVKTDDVKPSDAADTADAESSEDEKKGRRSFEEDCVGTLRLIKALRKAAIFLECPSALRGNPDFNKMITKFQEKIKRDIDTVERFFDFVLHSAADEHGNHFFVDVSFDTAELNSED